MLFQLFFGSHCYGQNPEKNLLQENLIRFLSSDRFLQNIEVKKNGTIISFQELYNKSDWQMDNYLVDVQTDLLTWTIRDQAGELYQIKYPNDFSLFYGLDKKGLQDQLFEEIKIQRSVENQNNCEPVEGKIETKVEEEKLGFLRKQYFINEDSLRVYGVEFPLESYVNLFMYPIDCHVVSPINLKFHRYGYGIDEILIHPSVLVNSLKSDSWSIWSRIENNELLLLFEHPFLSFNHMLFIKLNEQANNWQGNFHSFIPTSNIGDLFKDFESNENQIKIKVE